MADVDQSKVSTPVSIKVDTDASVVVGSVGGVAARRPRGDGDARGRGGH